MPLAPSAPAPSAATERLLKALDAAAARWAGTCPLRVEVSAEPADPLLWLAAQEVAPSFYWRGRGALDARAGLGAALTIETPTLDPTAGDVLDQLPPGASLFLTARFDAAAEVGEEWALFGSARLVLPRIEFWSDGRTATIAAHVAPGESPQAVRDALRRLRPAYGATSGALPLPFMRRDDPDRAEWDRMLRWSLGAFEHSNLDKVVLARRARFSFDAPIDAVALLLRLEAATPRCYHALVAPAGLCGPVFVTATPERLLRLDGRDAETEAVAGTRPRSEADAADDRLRDELLASEKDLREHIYVRDAIRDALAPLAATLDVEGEASAMTLARGRHLRTGIRATLREDVPAVEVARVLHPTPAVGGTPTAEALDAIRRLEPFDRGLYAGPIGWIGRDAQGRPAADLAVGIRSGLVDGRTLSLYSGAGIVRGSDPMAEWAEIEHKIGDFARVLGLSERVEA